MSLQADPITDPLMPGAQPNYSAATTIQNTRSPLSKVWNWLHTHPIKPTERNIIIGDLMNLGIWAVVGGVITWLLVRKRKS